MIFEYLIGNSITLSLYFLLLFFELLIVIIIIRFEHKWKSVLSFFWVILIFVYIIPSVLDPFNSSARLHIFGPDIDLTMGTILLRAHLFSLLFSFFFLISRLLFFSFFVSANSSLPFESYHFHQSERFFSGYYFIVLVFALFLILFSIVSKAGVPALLNASFGYVRANANLVLLNAAKYLAYSAIGIGYYFWLKRKYVYFFICIFITTSIFFISGGGRQIFLIFLTPFALHLFFRKSLKAKLSFFTIGLGFYTFFIILLEIRHSGGFPSGLLVVTEADFYIKVFFLLLEGGEAKLRYAYYYFIDSKMQLDGFGQGLTYARLLMFFVPSVYSLGLKPKDFDEVLYSEFYGPDHVGLSGTLHILIFGSSYVNFGWFGIFLGSFWGIFLGFFEVVVKKTYWVIRICLLSLFSGMLLMLLRGAVYGSFMNVIGGALIAATGISFYKLFYFLSKDPQ